MATKPNRPNIGSLCWDHRISFLKMTTETINRFQSLDLMMFTVERNPTRAKDFGGGGGDDDLEDCHRWQPYKTAKFADNHCSSDPKMAAKKGRSAKSGHCHWWAAIIALSPKVVRQLSPTNTSSRYGNRCESRVLHWSSVHWVSLWRTQSQTLSQTKSSMSSMSSVYYSLFSNDFTQHSFKPTQTWKEFFMGQIQINIHWRLYQRCGKSMENLWKIY